MDRFLIVGLGASAGGIQALQTFFGAVPLRSGIAYVVILHLSPDYDSQLAQVLQATTAMPVQQVLERTRLAPDQVYVVPPDKHLTVQDNYLLVSPNTEMAERRAPVDIFFRSLAEAHQDHAVAVVLSGTGANGSMGLKRIKERGGAVFVQSPREAEFNEMPRNAIATDLVDEVLNVADMPAKIIAYRDSLGSVHIPEEPKDRQEQDQQALRAVLTELRLRTGHDFANYKRPTLLRRIERRIHVRSLPDLPAYAAFLIQHPEETQALLKDLLISVTNFFRDRKPFEELESTLLPQLLEGKTAEDQLRIWVAGCATGEEAYSIAMICADLTIGTIDAPKVQIFATDIDESAIATAREGFYTLNDAADIPPEHLSRYFTKEGDGYRVRRELRETVLFASHNFLKDSPFSRIDLVSCRNVLIYLNRAAQERVFETFHFALRPGGFLLLGTSESVDGANDLFSALNREQHIWQSRQVTSKNIIVPESIPQIGLPQLPAKAATQARASERISFGDLHQQLLELYAPPSLIVDEEYEIVHLSEQAGRFLKFGSGEPSQNLLRVVHEELRAELRSALYQAAQHHTAVSALGLKMRLNDQTEHLNIHVRPVPETGRAAARGYLLVVFETMTGDAGNADSSSVVLTVSGDSSSRHLEEEVLRLKVQLRASNEQHEFQAEELKAGNEELQAMNEELRSATEELETSKEELQSINEELSTVNQELKVKVEEATLISNNLQNLINSTDIGTVFLDRSLRVVLFTPAVRAVFNLIPADYGRPLADIKSKLLEDNLLEDAANVLQRLQVIEREAVSIDRHTFLIRLAPYRTADDRIQGVVISLLDITERKQTQDIMAASLRDTQVLQTLSQRLVTEESIQRIYDEVMHAAILLTRADAGTVQILDEDSKELALLATRGFEPGFTAHFQRVDAASETSCGIALASGKRSFVDFDDPSLPDSDGSLRLHVDAGYLSAQSTPLVSRSGKPIGMVSTHWKTKGHRPSEHELRFLDLLARQAADFIEQRQVQSALRRSEEKHRTLFEAMRQGYAENELIRDSSGRAVDYRMLLANEQYERLTGLSREGALSRTARELMPGLEQIWIDRFDAIVRSGEPARFEDEVKELGRWYEVHVYPREGDCFAVLYDDITERRQREAATALLDEISKDLSVLSTPDEIIAAVGERLGEFLHVSTCIFSDIDEAKDEVTIHYGWNAVDVPSLKQTFRMADYFGEEFRRAGRAGETIAISDTATDSRVNTEAYARLELGALVNVPFQKQGRWVANISVTSKDARDWRGDEIELLQEIANRIFPRIERARAEEALRASEEKYRTLFETMGQGYALCEMIRDADGRPVDLRYVELNAAFERLTGVTVAQAQGRTGQQVYTGIERFWLEAYDAVIRRNEPQYIENKFEPTGRWYGVFIYPAGGDRIIALFEDITERKREEQRQEFTLKLTDTLRALSNRSEIQDAVTQLLAEQLDTARCYFMEIDEDRHLASMQAEALRAGIPSAIGEYDLALYEEVIAKLRGGKPLVIGNWDGGKKAEMKLGSEAESSMAPRQVVAQISAPVIKGGRLVGTLTVNDNRPRNWTDVDVRLVVESAERTWLALEKADAEAALRESEEKYRSLFNSMDEGYCLIELIYDDEGKAVDFHMLETNPAFELASGLRVMGGKTALQLNPGIDPMWIEHAARVAETGEALRLEGYDAGIGRWVDVHFSRVGDTADGTVGIIFQDITARKAAEERHAFLLKLSDALRPLSDPLAVQDEACRVLGDHLGVGWVQYTLVDPERGIMTNMREHQRAGLPSQVGGTYPLDAFPVHAGAWRSGRTLALDDVAGDQRLEQGERDGMLGASVGAALSAPLVKDGQLVAIMSVLEPSPRTWRTEDIVLLEETAQRTWAAVERVRTEESLRISEERYRVALQSADMAAWDWDVQEDTVRWNDQHFLLLGLQPEDKFLTSGFFLQFIHPDDLDAVSARLRQAVEESGQYEMEAFRIVKANGAVRWMSGFGRVVSWNNGRAARMVGVMYDITERKQLEQQKEQFVGIASHELRTPVTSIKAYAEILQLMFEQQGNDQSAALMRKLDGQVDRLIALINALLDSTSIVEGRLQLQKTEFEMNALITDTAETLQPIAGRQRIELALGATPLLHGDKDRIRQVLVNLIGNAIKYAAGTERIVVRSSADEREVQVCVQDFGPGIAESEQPQLFQRFFRSGATSTAAGLGLGLFISATIIQEHGGTISVQSTKGAGALFCFTIPIAAR